MKIISPRKAEVTVKRPDGTIETVIHPKIDYITEGILSQMRDAMKKAGRGEILSYRNIEAITEMEDSDFQPTCTRCKTALDTRTAYGQKEWSRFGGRKVQVVVHYCPACAQLLRAVGAGETTEMQHRAGYVPSSEPTTKED